MIRWCAYCQKFLGERPPYTDFRPSHGICGLCAHRGVDLPEDAELRMNYLVQFQRALGDLGRSGDLIAATALIERAEADGIRAADVLVGFLGPLLVQGEMEDSADLTSFCLELITRTRARMLMRTKSTDLPDVLFVTPHGNVHVIGMILLELWLHGEGIHARCIPQGLHPADLVQAYLKHRPKVLGFSLASVDQVTSCRDSIRDILKVEGCPPLFLAGGSAIRSGDITPQDFPEASLVSDDSKLFLTLKTHLSLGFIYDLKRKRAG